MRDCMNNKSQICSMPRYPRAALNVMICNSKTPFQCENCRKEFAVSTFALHVKKCESGKLKEYTQRRKSIVSSYQKSPTYKLNRQYRRKFVHFYEVALHELGEAPPKVQTFFKNLPLWHPLSWNKKEVPEEMFPVEWRLAIMNASVEYTRAGNYQCWGNDKAPDMNSARRKLSYVMHKDGPEARKYKTGAGAYFFTSLMNFGHKCVKAYVHVDARRNRRECANCRNRTCNDGYVTFRKEHMPNGEYSHVKNIVPEVS